MLGGVASCHPGPYLALPLRASQLRFPGDLGQSHLLPPGLGHFQLTEFPGAPWEPSLPGPQAWNANVCPGRTWQVGIRLAPRKDCPCLALKVPGQSPEIWKGGSCSPGPGDEVSSFPLRATDGLVLWHTSWCGGDQTTPFRLLLPHMLVTPRASREGRGLQGKTPFHPAHPARHRTQALCPPVSLAVQQHAVVLRAQSHPGGCPVPSADAHRRGWDEGERPIKIYKNPSKASRETELRYLYLGARNSRDLLRAQGKCV